MIGLLVRIFSRPLRQCSCRLRYSDRPKCGCGNMDSSNLNLLQKKSASFRLCNVSGHTTELLEIGVQNPTLQLIVIPGNPGVVTFYKEFVESLYHLFEGRASVTAVGHISHTKKDWENGKLFSLEEQIEHKVDFLKHELVNTEATVVLVGHSIGAYISLEVFRRVSELVAYCIGLYPFLALDMQSSKQSMIGKLSASSILCTALSSLAGILGLLPNWVSKYLVKNSVGISWSVTAAEAACTHLLQYHTLRNVLFMAMTEFRKRNLTGQL
uniref:Lipid droplet-associated hydrolase n=2 Tax=Kalanchoe fedtschenkoi TaxID=63787 RepID=A0A7N0V3G2_KALFE